MSPAAEASRPNGAIWAAILASGIGSFAVGLVVILNESGIFTAPTLYAPAGGVSGRTTIAAIIWLASWVVLHRRWRDRHLEGGGIAAIAFLFVLLGIVGTFPPVWSVF